MAKLTFKIWVLIFCLVAALIAINPSGYFVRGVLIKAVQPNSTAAAAGISSGEVIKAVDGQQVSSVIEYSAAIEEALKELRPVEWTIKAANETFTYTSTALNFEVDENATITAVWNSAATAGLAVGSSIEEINGNNIANKEDFNSVREELEPKIKLTITTNKDQYLLLVSEAPRLTISEIPKTHLRTGLDLQGGAKALVKPEKKLTSGELSDLLRVSRERMNVYGIADVNIRSTTDLSGNSYMSVEVAGATPAELEELIAKQGKFEAKIGNETIFIGGKKDIVSVARNPPEAVIRECLPVEGGFYCKFQFSVYLSPEAAKRQANVTAELEENISATGERILSKTLDLYLDDKLVDSLQIMADLKGRAVTQVAITGPGYGPTKLEAYEVAEANMAKLQTVLITGSLPFKLSIVKLDSISPLLGKEFTRNVFFAAFIAIAAVALFVYIRYRRITLAIPIVLTMLSEIVIILGIAALIRWNLDLASIAGIIAAIGVGVDHQIVIVDESRLARQYSWKERIKRAFFIIFGAFATTCVAMLPLWWAGAGLLRGFMVTTIAGITAGVLITRPAFADMISKLTREEE